MDKDFYMNDFEQLLRDKTEEFKMYPSESVWTNVYNKLHPGRKWGIIGGSVLLLLFTASVLVLRTNNSTAKKEASAEKNTQQTSIAVNHSVPADADQIGTPKISDQNLYNITRSSGVDHTLSHSISSQDYKVLSSSNSEFGLNNFSAAYGIISDVTKVIPGNFALSNALTSSATPVSSEMMSDLSDAPATQFEKDPVLFAENVYVNANSFNNTIKKASVKKASRFEWQFYFAPSSSYRALYKDADNTGLAYAYSGFIPGDISKAVNHTPAMGFEIGNAFLFSLSNSIKIKAGAQLNYSRYNIKAYSTPYPELTTIRLRSNNNQPQDITVTSSYKNYGVYYEATTIGSQNVAISIPLGVDLKMTGNKKLSWYVSGSFQPTYILNNKAFLITNDLKNYVQNADLFRKFTMNTGVETFLRFERNNGVALQIGPQIRYQINSSYTKKYPISEHLIEYGLKVGITKKF
ncbi:MAG: hypothetical protein HYX40_11205 [Sphingobacteriales bacterium]|nr:hypothetical protein [Sphingobacteriales bacterium]